MGCFGGLDVSDDCCCQLRLAPLCCSSAGGAPALLWPNAPCVPGVGQKSIATTVLLDGSFQPCFVHDVCQPCCVSASAVSTVFASSGCRQQRTHLTFCACVYVCFACAYRQTCAGLLALHACAIYRCATYLQVHHIIYQSYIYILYIFFNNIIYWATVAGPSPFYMAAPAASLIQ